MESSPLLALPGEIRQIILTNLLHHPTCNGQLPRYLDDSPPALYAPVLRTCHQLYAESIPFFYNSTVHLEVRRKSGPFRGVSGGDAYAFRIIYLGRVFTPHSLPTSIRERTNRINIQVWAHRSDDFYRVDHIQEQVRNAAYFIKQQPNWQTISLRACTFTDEPLYLAEKLWPLKVQPLLPLSYLRNRASFTCYGADEAFTQSLTDAITSNSVLIDLDEMYDTFAAIVQSTLPPPLQPGRRRTETEFLLIRAAQEGERLLEQLQERCGPARDQGDVTRFLTERTILVRKLRDVLIDRQRTSSLPITLQDPTAVLERLEGLLLDDCSGAGGSAGR